MIKVSEVTLMTDASVDQSGNGGFGYWCVSTSRGGQAGGAKLEGYIKDSYMGECLGVINALIDCINKGLIKDHDNVLIQLDNTGVIRLLSDSTSKVRSDLLPMVLYYEDMVKQHSLNIKFKHVKGHATNTTSRYKANSMCDLKANYYRKLKPKYKGANHASKY